jgi:hypothetical protein
LCSIVLENLNRCFILNRLNIGVRRLNEVEEYFGTVSAEV